MNGENKGLILFSSWIRWAVVLGSVIIVALLAVQSDTFLIQSVSAHKDGTGNPQKTVTISLLEAVVNENGDWGDGEIFVITNVSEAGHGTQLARSPVVIDVPDGGTAIFDPPHVIFAHTQCNQIGKLQATAVQIWDEDNPPIDDHDKLRNLGGGPRNLTADGRVYEISLGAGYSITYKVDIASKGTHSSCESGGVGGIGEQPELAGAPLETGGSSGPGAGVLAGAIAGAVAAGAVALGGVAWYARRRWLR